MDERLLRVVIGLALESALVHRRGIPSLASFYSEPDAGLVRELHDRLIDSGDHCDREAAIWLGLALEQGDIGSNPRGLVVGLREMEFVLYMLMPRSGEALQEVNLWMSFIANAAHSVEDGFWIDAKLLLSRALQVSQSPPVEGLRAESDLGYEVDVLQRATASYFDEVKGYPVRLRVAEDRMEAILKVQEHMLDLMRIHYREEQWGSPEATRTPIHRMSSAIRHLMDEGKELGAPKLELQLASEHLERWVSEIAGGEERTVIQAACEGIKEVIGALRDLNIDGLIFPGE
ncbi:hypothetical protein AC482_07170 [miscellaneous Crenarchaeota group-15 archaeon DG-45]|uniref:Uncharacterized protein n=1 Tax=miscellaneous Crenarchaeota group-15 archaeon DG-45 TaxID=1685127 RepID=A0A0M0BLJ9_9ARCH|nr:MAG: hypothetical protein AC482_07170 [miscellaneous Crenarchaeota group-15 archaeon DG-45]